MVSSKTLARKYGKGLMGNSLSDLVQMNPRFDTTPDHELADIIIASRLDPLVLGKFVFGWDPQPHHEEWVDFLLYNEDGTPATDDRGVSAPPASAKTNWTGIVLSSWILGNHPEDHIIYTSKTGLQAEKVSNAVKETIEKNERFHLVFPNCKPNYDRGWGEKEWYLERENTGDKDASFFAVGIGGPIMNARGDYIIIDDPQDKTTSGTPFQREKAVEYVQQQVMTRKSSKGRAFIIMMRWHQDDVAGHYQKLGYKWKSLPALQCTQCGQGQCQCANRKIKSYWPTEWPTRKLLKIRNEDPGMFEKIYQGNPRGATSNLFSEKSWQYYDRMKPPPMAWRVMILDTAQKEDDTASYTVISHWGKGKDGNYYLLDLLRDRMEFPDLLSTTKSLYYELKPDEIAIEEKSSGIQLIQSIIAETGVDVQRIKPTESKWERARAISPIQKSGKCYLPKDISWAYDFIEEHSSFPGKFTDQVDTTAHALLWLRPIEGDVDVSSADVSSEITQRFRGAVGGYGRVETPEAASFDWVATKGSRTGSRWKKFSNRRPGESSEIDVDDFSGGY